MKYNDSNQPLICMQTNSRCYKRTKKMKIKGVLWHSTGINNTNLKRYVQPYDNSNAKEHPDNTYTNAEWIKVLGKNPYNNDWNHTSRAAGLNFWIGKLADGTVTSVQTMPWDYRPWGCGGGKNGSCNDGWIQFEICEDNLKNPVYFEQIYKEACEITAYLCKKFNIDPNATVRMGNVDVPTITCHGDATKMGVGSSHVDINHWFPKYGKSMVTARADVTKLLNADTPEKPDTPEEDNKVSYDNIQVGDILKFTGTLQYTSANSSNGKKAVPNTIKVLQKYLRTSKHPIHARAINDSGKYISGVYGWIDIDKLEKDLFEPYEVKVTANALNCRSGPGTNYSIKCVLKKGEVCTIVDEQDGWGLVQGQAGWICLSYTQKI